MGVWKRNVRPFQLINVTISRFCSLGLFCSPKSYILNLVGIKSHILSILCQFTFIFSTTRRTFLRNLTIDVHILIKKHCFLHIKLKNPLWECANLLFHSSFPSKKFTKTIDNHDNYSMRSFLSAILPYFINTSTS